MSITGILFRRRGKTEQFGGMAGYENFITTKAHGQLWTQMFSFPLEDFKSSVQPVKSQDSCVECSLAFELSIPISVCKKSQNFYARLMRWAVLGSGDWIRAAGWLPAEAGLDPLPPGEGVRLE